MAGLGGKVEFICGADVAAVFIDMAENWKSTAQNAPLSIRLGNGEVSIGASTISFMDETYPSPISGEWVPKLDPKTLMAIATDVPGTIWYCAIDSISANNSAVPLHIVPIQRDDDSGITLIGQAKPMPAKAVQECVHVLQSRDFWRIARRWAAFRPQVMGRKSPRPSASTLPALRCIQTYATGPDIE